MVTRPTQVFGVIDYPDQGIAGDICRDMLALYRTNDFVIPKDTYVRKDGVKRTRLERFEDILEILKAHDELVHCVVNAEKQIVVSFTGDYLTIEDFQMRTDPNKTMHQNTFLVNFHDGTSVRIGIDFGMMIGEKHSMRWVNTHNHHHPTAA